MVICTRKFRANTITPNQYSHTAHCKSCCQENVSPEEIWFCTPVEDSALLFALIFVFPPALLIEGILFAITPGSDSRFTIDPALPAGRDSRFSVFLSDNCCGTGSSGRLNAISR